MSYPLVTFYKKVKKSYTCETCDATFKTRLNLKKHVTKHWRERLFGQGVFSGVRLPVNPETKVLFTGLSEHIPITLTGKSAGEIGRDSANDKRTGASEDEPMGETETTDQEGREKGSNGSRELLDESAADEEGDIPSWESIRKEGGEDRKKKNSIEDVLKGMSHVLGSLRDEDTPSCSYSSHGESTDSSDDDLPAASSIIGKLSFGITEAAG